MAPLKITIPYTHTHEGDGKPYTEYEVRIAHPFPRGTTTVKKRYSDFDALNSALHSHVGAAPPASLPPNTVSSPEQISKRQEGLEKYLQAIETDEDGRWRVCPAYREFLNLGDKEGKGARENFPGSQFGKDRVRDPGDWLDKFNEARSNIQEARLWLTKREQATVASAQHEASANAKRGLVKAGTLLSALDEGLDRFAGQGGDGGEKLGPGETRRRKDDVSKLRKERDSLDAVLNTMAVKSAISGSGASTPSSSAAVTKEQKAGLFKGSAQASGRRVLGGPAKETDRTRELDNQGVLQLQKQIMHEQDEDVMDLATVVRRMKEMGVQINEEVVRQNAELGLFEEDVERVDAKIRIAKKRADQIR
ncbi:Phox homologous domain-containing protein [Lophiotrema nucula]|uniref:Phox homologous domain-containing protein n=1 Tax=Lophiotrema nucula TaxID=690887 RepID=A0A6A5ZEX3_9PLEO|nr:Phox homologous domain-containing protein [Lophiotrema nucula]